MINLILLLLFLGFVLVSAAALWLMAAAYLVAEQINWYYVNVDDTSHNWEPWMNRYLNSPTLFNTFLRLFHIR